MDDIKIEKSRLLENIQRNREKHLAEYDEAVKGWKEKVRDAVVKELKRLDKGKKPNLYFLQSLPEPTSYEDQYDEAIAMLEWEKEDEVQLTFAQFKQWVNDEWGWSRQFLASTKAYHN